MDGESELWVCALRVDYADGNHTYRVIHRGPERECEALAALVPASSVEVDPAKLPPGVPPPQMIEVPQPEGKIAVGATVVVCRASMIPEVA